MLPTALGDTCGYDLVQRNGETFEILKLGSADRYRSEKPLSGTTTCMGLFLKRLGEWLPSIMEPL